jgi:S-DNA-T family DNA segregation ATPase FtsK/SpoIIIE
VSHERLTRRAGRTDDADGAVDELELADDTEARSHSPARARLAPDGVRATTRRPIVPPWARSLAAFKQAASWQARYWAYTLGYHATRTPKYGGRLLVRAPRGAARTLTRAARHVLDTEGHPVRMAIVGAASVRIEEAHTYLRLSQQRDARVRARLAGAGAVFLVAAGGGVALWRFGPAWMHWATLGALTVVFGLLGAPDDKPLLDTPITVHKVPRLTGPIVTRALAVAVPAIRTALGKDPGAVEFVDDITRDGPGYRAIVNLPHGITVGDVAEKREQLSSGLRRQLGCVWPEGDPHQHEGRLVLWVGDRDLAEIRGKRGLAWKLARTGSHDVFRPIPYGADARGRPVAVPLLQHNILIGSIPGQGKTGVVRVLACGCALDPTCELWIHELKGSGDLDPLGQVAHRFCSGIDDESIAYAAESLALLRREVIRRATALKQLPRDLCPDKRITREIANRRTLKLWPLTCVIDEAQNLFIHAEHGKQAADDAEFIIRIGRAFGVSLILATQRPDKDSLPSGVKGNVSIRICLYVGGQVENDMILGTGAYKRGVNAAALRPEIDAGIGYLVGATAAPTIACAAYLDGPATELVARRARLLRQRAGTLSGYAIGEESETVAREGGGASLLADILAVLPAAEPRIWSETLCGRLQELRPEVYGGWDARTLAAALKPLGVSTGQLWGQTPAGEGTNRKGVLREHIAAAAADHDRRRGGRGGGLGPGEDA